MAKISVNDEYVVNGKLTISRVLNMDNEIVISGTFASHYYFEEINTLTTYRYEIKGIEVREELFGSDDFDIVYNFTAKEFDVRDGAMTNLTDKEIDAIEVDMYNEKGYLLDSNMKVVGEDNE